MAPLRSAGKGSTRGRPDPQRDRVELDFLVGREAEDLDPRLPEVVQRARAPKEIPPEPLPLPEDQDVKGRGLRGPHRREQAIELLPLDELRPRDGLVPVDVALVHPPALHGRP